MLSHEAMAQLREAYFPFSSVTEADVLAQLGNPSAMEIIETALVGMKSADRNVRVLMLRVLAGQHGEKAMAGILVGLHDEARRVRSVAIKSCGNYLGFSVVTDRLQAIVTNDDEIRKIQGQALSVLAGHNLPITSELTAPMAQTLETLAQIERYRWQILFGLLRLDLTDRVEALLRAFVKDGSKEEAILATRALSGYRVIHIGVFEDNRTTHQHITQTCDLAAGRMFYWITRTEYDDLLKQQSAR